MEANGSGLHTAMKKRKNNFRYARRSCNFFIIIEYLKNIIKREIER